MEVSQRKSERNPQINRTRNMPGKTSASRMLTSDHQSSIETRLSRDNDVIYILSRDCLEHMEAFGIEMKPLNADHLNVTERRILGQLGRVTKIVESHIQYWRNRPRGGQCVAVLLSAMRLINGLADGILCESVVVCAAPSFLIIYFVCRDHGANRIITVLTALVDVTLDSVVYALRVPQAIKPVQGPNFPGTPESKRDTSSKERENFRATVRRDRSDLLEILRDVVQTLRTQLLASMKARRFANQEVFMKTLEENQRRLDEADPDARLEDVPVEVVPDVLFDDQENAGDEMDTSF